MTTNSVVQDHPKRIVANKVPEVIIWFWIIKILCTTVGESFADWINTTLGVGLTNTALLFTAVLAVVLAVQMRLPRYVPVVYWLTVVVVSITGTLYTDILTDSHGVPLWLSSTVFAALLIAVFGLWFARERTLSIHSITTTPREAFYWLAVLVTFALGTAVGDWTLELTGWGPGVAVLLPAALIAVVAVAWRIGGQPVLAFWLAYILTRPLGANIGDWFASPTADGGLGLGTAMTSLLFLTAIAATVAYLSWTKSDVTSPNASSHSEAHTDHGDRHRAALTMYVIAAMTAASVMAQAAQSPHASAATDETGGQTSTVTHMAPATAIAHFPASDVSTLRGIVTDASKDVSSGQQSAATARADELENAWDAAQSRLKPANPSGWTYLDGQIDSVLTSLRASTPDPATETSSLKALSTTLGG
ncbi:hypothetical protein AZH51_01325 [Branchiibius sp. NY16-3462-2]|nr:hypothetical protein AZH51_01325 [Branchiibius sp. NY16-3462-2]